MNNLIKAALKNPFRAYKNMKEIYDKALMFDEIMISQDYYWLYERIKPKTTLLDIGAFMGDTAFYFGMNKNIKRIIAYEKEEKYYNMAIKNCKNNPFNDPIIQYYLDSGHGEVRNRED